jgi:transaldolase
MTLDPRRLRVKLFADGADIAGLLELCKNPQIKGFTTNPTLMRSAGVTDYEGFAHALLEAVPHLPISFEVFSDDFEEMRIQALRIASWGDNVYVKVPITNTRGAPCGPIVRTLAASGVKVNVTALTTLEQVQVAAEWLSEGPSCFVSVFAGRIADTGLDPVPIMAKAVDLVASNPNVELVWASPREILNVVQADAIGCHVITLTHDLLKKLHLLGHDLTQLSLETVRMFHDDARAAGYAFDGIRVAPERD